MAKIKLSSIGITNISGKAGGTIYSKNKGGNYIRNFVMPSNTFSEIRQAVRSLFGALASTWRTLTNEQRNSFAEQAPFYKKLDVFADLKQLSPIALYQKLNMQLSTANLPLIDTCIAPEGTNAVTSQTAPLEIHVATEDIAFDLGLESDNAVPSNVYVLEATPPVSPSIKNVANMFRVFAISGENGGTNPVASSLAQTAFSADAEGLWTLYATRFGAPTVGAVVHFRIKAVNSNTGEVSAYWYFEGPAEV